MAELMKGHEWSKYKHKMKYPAWVEIKHDEIRVHVKLIPPADWRALDKCDVQFLSYAGNPLPNMEQFIPLFAGLMLECGVVELDCGFEANGNFRDSSRWIKSTTGLPDDLLGVPYKWFVYDLPTMLDAPYGDRMARRRGIVANGQADGFPELFEPGGKWAADEAAVDQLYLDAIECGYEGIMAKTVDHFYQRGKRTYGWLKRKPVETFDGIIIGINRAESMEKVPLDRAGSVDVRREDGHIDSVAGIGHELGRDMMKNPDEYIGQWLEYCGMEIDSADGVRHPRWKRLREAKA